MRREELIQRIVATRDRWLNLLTALGPVAAGEPDACGSWSARQVAAHVANWIAYAAALARAIADGRRPSDQELYGVRLPLADQLNGDQLNALMLGPALDESFAATISRLQAACEALLQAIHLLDDAALFDPHYQVVWLPWKGERSLATLLAELCLDHADLHADALDSWRNAAEGSDLQALFGAFEPDVAEPTLRRELLQMRDADQALRSSIGERYHSPREVSPADAARWQALDRQHAARLRQIIERYGWPSPPLVGADGAEAAWLLALHADSDPDLQGSVLPLLAAAVDAGRAAPWQYAELTDRVRLNTGRRQLYGTQLQLVNGQLIPRPIDDPAGVDARRAALGLPPLADELDNA